MRVFRRDCLVLGFLLFCGIRITSGSPQSEVEYFQKDTDTSYIEDYKELLTTRFYLLAQNTSLVIFPDLEATMVFQPNETGRFGLAAFYSWFGLGLSVGTKLFRKNPDIYGSTKAYDFRVNAYGKFMAVEGYLQYYQGFYMNYRSKDLKETFKIPGMDLISIGIDGMYIYNFSKFSIRASFTQDERQKRSAGSLIVKPTIRYYYVNSDTGIIPGKILDIYSLKQENILSGNFYTLGLGPGYIYTLVFLKNFYLTAGGQIEMNWSSYHYNTTYGSYRKTGFSFPTSIRVALGYNSDPWFIGSSFISTVYYFQPGPRVQDDFHYHLTQIRFWAGTRFNAFKRWNKKKL
ncbi:MAG: DUF4421 family protein [Bacteroidales bacterium]|nr:DUF4421 family protein [Bacteroidales bacterium]